MAAVAGQKNGHSHPKFSKYRLSPPPQTNNRKFIFFFFFTLELLGEVQKRAKDFEVEDQYSPTIHTRGRWVGGDLRIM
jgi:hypothetical protein